MSPTMTEGGIAAWKKQVGDSFTAGDVVFEIVRPPSSSSSSSPSRPRASPASHLRWTAR